MSGKICENSTIWNPSEEHVSEIGTVLTTSDGNITVRTDSDTVVVNEEHVLPLHTVNSDDFTTCSFINEANLLHSARERWMNQQPYTFVGNVLIAVNPLVKLPEPLSIGNPHP